MTVKSNDESVKLSTKVREYYVIVYEKDGERKITIEDFWYNSPLPWIIEYLEKTYGKNKRHGPFYQENWAVQKAMELEEGK